MKKIILINAVLFLSLTCYSQTKKWENTQEVNTIEAYQKFLAEYPDRKYSTQAKENLISLEYEKALKENSIDSYKYFLDNYPESKFKDEIQRKFEKVSWEEAKKNNTAKSYNDYLKNNPDGINKNDAITQLESILLTNAAHQGDMETFQSLLPKISDKDVLSKSLMMAVWGYCHMSVETTWSRESGLKNELVRTAKAPKQNYASIINLLIQSGASIERYRYQNFGSATPPDAKVNSISESGQYYSSTTTFGRTGTKTNGNLDLVDFTERGESIQQVVTNEKAVEIQEILRLKD